MQKKSIIVPLLMIGFTFMSFVSGQSAYILYDTNGKETDYEKMLERASKADIVLFGELHNNPICHWMELELTKDLFDVKKEKLILGAEMFEADDQIVLNEYLASMISDKTFKDESKQWTNYNTDYKPLVEFAKKNHIPFIASNIPRRYANMIFNRGIKVLDSISNESKQWMCPLPYAFDSTLKCYKEISKATGGHGGENLQRSQAIKDATMAYFILKNWKQGNTFLHYNGAYHSNNYESMVWYLKQANPDLDIVTISSYEATDIESSSNETTQLADFILYIPSSMSKSY